MLPPFSRCKQPSRKYALSSGFINVFPKKFSYPWVEALKGYEVLFFTDTGASSSYSDPWIWLLWEHVWAHLNILLKYTHESRETRKLIRVKIDWRKMRRMNSKKWLFKFVTTIYLHNQLQVGKVYGYKLTFSITIFFTFFFKFNSIRSLLIIIIIITIQDSHRIKCTYFNYIVRNKYKHVQYLLRIINITEGSHQITIGLLFIRSFATPIRGRENCNRNRHAFVMYLSCIFWVISMSWSFKVHHTAAG